MIFLFYAAYAVLWFCVVGTVLCLWASLYVLVFLGTAVAMILRAIFRSSRPRNPPLPRRPIPQAKWSNRR